MYSPTFSSFPNSSYISSSLSQSLNTLSSSSSNNTMQQSQPSSPFFNVNGGGGGGSSSSSNNLSSQRYPSTATTTNTLPSVPSLASRNYVNNPHSLTVNTSLPKAISPSFGSYSTSPHVSPSSIGPSVPSVNTTVPSNYTINSSDTWMDPLSSVSNVDQVRKLSLYFNNTPTNGASTSTSTSTSNNNTVQASIETLRTLLLQSSLSSTKTTTVTNSTTGTPKVSLSSSSPSSASPLPIDESFLWLITEPVPFTTKLSLSSINWTQAIMDIFALIGTTSLTQEHINKGIELLCTSSLPSSSPTNNNSSSVSSSLTTPLQTSLHSPTFIHHPPFQLNLLPNYIKHCPALAAALLYGILRSCSRTVSEPYLRYFIDSKTYTLPSSPTSTSTNANDTTTYSNHITQHLETINLLLSYTRKYTSASPTEDATNPPVSITTIVPTYARILPINFLPLYSGMLLTLCENTKDKYAQNRLVRLVCIFIQTLIQHQFILLNPAKITTVTDYHDYYAGDELPAFVAHLESFCVEFTRVTDAVNLYKLLKNNS